MSLPATSIDMLGLADAIYRKMKNVCEFSFEDGKFLKNRAHQVLLSVGVYAGKLQELAESAAAHDASSDPMFKVLLRQIAAGCALIIKDKNWAYPDNSLSHERSHGAIRCVETSLAHYRDVQRPLALELIPEMPAPFDLATWLDEFAIQPQLSYVYENNTYALAKAHPCFQMLIAATDCAELALRCLKTQDPDLQPILDRAAVRIHDSKSFLNDAYPPPENSFDAKKGPELLSKFIESWKEFKIFTLSDLASYERSRIDPGTKRAPSI